MSFSVPLCDAGARVQCNARRQGVVPHAASSTPHTRHLANVVHTEAPRRPALLSASERLSASTLRPSARQSASRGPVLASATAPQALQSSVTPTEVPRKQGVRDGAWQPIDQELVEETIADARVAAQPSTADKGGSVLLGKSIEQLQDLAVEYGQPKFRGKQIYDAIYNGATTIDAIVQVPAVFRTALKVAGVKTGRSVLHNEVKSVDGTRKFLCQLSDGRVVEAVGIPMGRGDKKTLTACISSQVGCPMRCTFCATGKGGFARNLMPHEIVDQVLHVQAQFGQRVGNVVFMGMGEPLLNVASVVRAFEVLNGDMKIGARGITISTVGVKGGIRELASHKLQCVLAVSIHAPTQALRRELVPSAKAYTIDQLMTDCQDYFQTTSRRVSFEYTLLHGRNDSPSHAMDLASLIKGYDLAAHVNVIPWNPVDESEFKRPSARDIAKFTKVLEDSGISSSVRITRGLDAAAACGQLRNDFQKQSLPEPAELA